MSSITDGNGHTNRPIDQQLFSNGVPLFSGLDFGSLHRIRLNETIKFCLIAPSAIKGVELDVASGRIANNWITPVRQFDLPAGGFGGKELGCAEGWSR